MRKKAIKVADMTKIPDKYKGQWVAITLGETNVVGSGYTPLEAKAASKGIPNVVVTKVPEKAMPYLF
ncbi:MAG: DUF5678 domain-containing protein [Candidatus Desantisbacteria bacterium]